MRKTIFISDLHLDETHPEAAEKFIQMTRDLGSDTDAVYILGDLFEVWIGDDENTLFQQQIKQALKSLVHKGVPVYFMHGNRDFLVGGRFLDETGCRLLPDETRIKVYQTDALIMHGDTLCTKDIDYLKARKVMRNLFLQKIFLLLPLVIRKKIAAAMRAKSRQHTASASSEVMDVTPDAVTEIFRKHKVSCLVHGHTHRPDIHVLEFERARVFRIVLGAWHERGNMLVWDAAGNRQLVDF
ncbi:UDP-2,3-diacylglucosamine diphosphatase [Aquicella siphonis]|nr:UDP-2,3-diacylglucosamine diphosphatase [Aquicella siphonis]